MSARALFDVLGKLRLEQGMIVPQVYGLADCKVERPQHLEAIMRFRKIGMRLLDDGASALEPPNGRASDLCHFRIYRRDTEVSRVGDALRPPAGAHGVAEGSRRLRQRQRIGRMLARHRVEQQRHVFDIARHRALHAQGPIDF